MPKQCDHKSCGMILWQDGELLLIERKKPPFGFAPPAGHIDGDGSFEEAASRDRRTKESILDQLVEVSYEKELKEILKNEKKALARASGICLFLNLGEPEKRSKAILSLKGLNRIPVPSFGFLNILRNLSFPLQVLSRATKTIKNRNVTSALILILIAVSGFYIFGTEKGEELARNQQLLAEVRSTIDLAENALIFRDEELAGLLFQEAHEKILPLTRPDFPLQKEALFLQKSIEENLSTSTPL